MNVDSVREEFSRLSVADVLGQPPLHWWEEVVGEHGAENVFNALETAVGRLAGQNTYRDERGRTKAGTFWSYAAGILRAQVREKVEARASLPKVYRIADFRKYIDAYPDYDLLEIRFEGNECQIRASKNSGEDPKS